MKYLLLAYTPADGWDAATADTPSEEALAAFATYQKFEEELRATGEFVSSEGLGHPAVSDDGAQDRVRGRRHRRAVRRAEGGAGELRDHRRRQPRSGPSTSSPGWSTCSASRSRSGRSWATTSPDGRPRLMADARDTTVEHLLRAEAPQVLGALVRRFGRFDVAEDAVQEALIAASRQWPVDGVPAEPRSWLIRVGYRRMIDLLRSEQARPAVARRRPRHPIRRWSTRPRRGRPSSITTTACTCSCCAATRRSAPRRRSR